MQYLTYTPWRGQINNTRMSLETAMVFAYLTDRTLVINNNDYRRHWRPQGDGPTWKPPHPEDYYELIGNKVYTDDLNSTYNLNFDPGSSVVVLDKPKDITNLSQFSSGRNLIYYDDRLRKTKILRLNKGLFELYYTFFFSNQPYKQYINQNLTFKQEIKDKAAKIIRQLGLYNAVHIRRGDFITKEKRNLSINSIMNNIFFDPDVRLYVATDETNMMFFAPLRKKYNCVFNELKEENNETIGCIEQLICSRAANFIGTRYSTFSSYITRLRGLNNMYNNKIRFTDGFFIEDNHETFSWVNWIKAGQPLWAREFWEGWS